MADRYWVGGTGSWNATTTNWSATNGGAGGASVPTLADDVFFTSLSNATAYVVTLTTAPVCRSVSVVGPAVGNVTIAGSAAWSIYGSFTLAATGVTWTYTGGIFFNASTAGFTVTTNGVSLSGTLSFQGGGEWTLGSAYTSSSSITVTAGVFATANFNITLSGGFVTTGSSVRSILLGSSAVSCQSWSALGATNLTVNAGTSTITITGPAGIFNGGSLTYYNVTKANNGFAIGDGGNTFNALTNTTATGFLTYGATFAGNQTIGTFTVNGGGIQQRISISSNIFGVQITLTVASFVTAGNIDFRDINLQGAASPLTVATGGNAGNNTNITLAAPKTVYWNLPAGGSWNVSAAWALTSGGAASTANYPLPQDTVIIEDTGLNSGATITLATVGIGTVDISTRTLPMTLNNAGQFPGIYGDFTLSSAVTTTAGTLTFLGYNKTQTFTSAGVSVLYSIIVNGTSTTFALGGALTMSTAAAFTLTLGTLNLANNTLTCGFFSSNNGNTRAITFGTGQINLTGNAATIWNFNNGTGLTVTGSATVNATYSGSTGTRSFSGYGTGTALINLNVTAGSDIVALFNVGYNNVNFTGFTGQTNVSSTTVSGNYTLNAGMTVVLVAGALAFNGTSGTQLITTNGVTVDAPVTFGGVSTYQLQDNLTLGSTRFLSLTNGALNLNGQTATCGTFTSATTNTRSIAFNGGTIVVSGATFTASGANLTTSGSGTINMTSASSKTFTGNNHSYPTLNQGGAGALVITGANTFANMTNTVQPATITFPASTTTTVSAFNVNGTAGNLVTLNSSTPGTRFTLLKI